MAEPGSTDHGGTDGPPTIHADAGHPDAGRPGSPVARRDPVLLVAGVVALVVAALAVVGPGVLLALDPRWLLAAAALATGVAVLATTIRRR